MQFTLREFGQDSQFTLKVDELPNKCPFCHHLHIPEADSISSKSYEILIITFKCTNQDCNELYLGYYKKNQWAQESRYDLEGVSFGKAYVYKFSESINKISTRFEKIYNQASQAEQKGLDEVCGPGYRKALEFLIKDYAVEKFQSKKEEIKEAKLATVIENFIESEKIKEVVKRAAWIGNDETHYERKWEDKDLSDFKDFINLIVKWLEEERLYEKMLKDMPSN